MQYQWILFDADETLFHFDAFAGLKLMFSRFDIDFTRIDFELYQKVNKPLWVDYQDGLISAAQLQTRRFTEWGHKIGVSAQQLNSAFLKAMGEICTLLPGAKALIDGLHGKVNLGIITNGFTALQTVRLEKTGLLHAFDQVVISEEVGIAKPDVGIFNHALMRMNNPERNKVLMVGDNPHSDILGGLNAGLDTCWLNSAKQPTPDGITPHYEVKSLYELQLLLTH
ncbi:pyrimidine 5'-nucleotidase [Shewanella sp. D64]|uniref:pyrimidine 5'-nucleotidase n=1 Tax=unclassified Shewanella TaxID=196818 RepID=UPI0022BA3D9B|nr:MULTISPECIES: pyrimidine 5'-nucleotidase [unclassified Shewanella]MEC4724176.1 pyrimidine 5'-nucleotidase [Shewanella sp. D64]MEC4736196.1 pyrimidine 5'-nucleotidase [Shewanella sp. E94]WBJ97869.1 pyrimidine 5'-nucleotidase [Shewanella sp. MTB7]